MLEIVLLKWDAFGCFFFTGLVVLLGLGLILGPKAVVLLVCLCNIFPMITS